MAGKTKSPSQTAAEKSKAVEEEAKVEEPLAQEKEEPTQTSVATQEGTLTDEQTITSADVGDLAALFAAPEPVAELEATVEAAPEAEAPVAESAEEKSEEEPEAVGPEPQPTTPNGNLIPTPDNSSVSGPFVAEPPSATGEETPVPNAEVAADLVAHGLLPSGIEPVNPDFVDATVCGFCNELVETCPFDEGYPQCVQVRNDTEVETKLVFLLGGHTEDAVELVPGPPCRGKGHYSACVHSEGERQAGEYPCPCQSMDWNGPGV